jgi:hypothetical protein
MTLARARRVLLPFVLLFVLSPQRARAHAPLSEVAQADPPVSDGAVPTITKGECVDANGNGQELRRLGKLASAREQLRTCASLACPAMVRDDCKLRLDELESVQPTIVVSVKSEAGAVLNSVRVTADGKLLTEHLDGTALALDLGEQTLHFESAGHVPSAQTLIVAAAEKLRSVDVILRARAPLQSLTEQGSGAAFATTDAAPAQAASGSRALNKQQLAGVVTGAVGVALVVAGGAFGLAASSHWSEAKHQCPTHEQCAAEAIDTRDTAATYASLSSAGFIAGGVLTALGVTLFVTAPRLAKKNVALGVAGTGIKLTGRF